MNKINKRAPFQVLVIPYIVNRDNIKYVIFKRSDDNNWQGIAGGGENDETPGQAARRESFEEAFINENSEFMMLQTVSSIPVNCFKVKGWSKDLFVGKLTKGSLSLRVNTN